MIQQAPATYLLKGLPFSPMIKARSYKSAQLTRSAVLLVTGLTAAFSQTAPTVRSVSSGVGGTTTTNVAPGGIVSISGTNLAQSSAGLGSSMGTTLPTALGNVQVSIGGRAAPLFMVSSSMIVAQVPFEVTAGQQNIQITSGGVTSTALPVTVANVAPALFSDGSGGLALKAADYSIVGAANPAASGDLLLLYATGLGQTTPALQTGSIAGDTPVVNTSPVSVLFGAQAAEPLYSIAAPGFAGLYQVAVRVPAGLAGTIPITLRSGSTTSPAVTILAGVRRGAQIDAQVQAVANQFRALGPKPLETLTPDEARRQPTVADAVKALLQSQGRPTTPEPVASVADRMIPGGAGMIPARVYTPSGAGPFPVIVYFHGGGFVIATVDTYDASARGLANAVGAIVVSVEYRKAPENKFPAAAEDAYAAVQWAITNAASINGQADRVAVAGESAGGNLSTVVCLMARDRSGRMPMYQALIYPVATLASESPSYEENGKAPFLTRDALRWFAGHYLRNLQDAINPYASPLLADVRGLPPATVITAGFDPLRDEGAGYADKLRQNGVLVDYRNYETMTHEFFGMGVVVDVARQALQQVANNLKAAFAR